MTVFSQVVTDTNKLVLSHAAAKAIAKDLIKCDSVVALSKIKDQHLGLLEKKVSLKDSVINYYRLKEVNYQYQIQNENAKTKAWEDQYKKLQADYKKLHVKHKITTIATIAIVLASSYLYITK